MGGKNKAPEYQAQEPAFLRQLRQQHAGSDSAQNHFTAHRPKRLDKDDQDDGPTYVLESDNETVSKEAYARLMAPNKDNPAAGDVTPSDAPTPKADESRQKHAGDVVIGSRKRKAVKAIVPQGINDTDDHRVHVDSAASTSTQSVKKRKKMAVATTLSFGDDD